jgi:hypothetical protein
LSSCTKRNDVLSDGTAPNTSPDPDADHAFQDGLKQMSSPVGEFEDDDDDDDDDDEDFDDDDGESL